MPVKFLCLCRGGNVRSVCLAWHLKDRGHEAISAGFDYLSADTLSMLFNWADKIVVMQPEFSGLIPLELTHKVMICDVGEDRYGNPMNRELKDQVKQWIRQENYAG